MWKEKINPSGERTRVSVLLEVTGEQCLTHPKAAKRLLFCEARELMQMSCCLTADRQVSPWIQWVSHKGPESRTHHQQH